MEPLFKFKDDQYPFKGITHEREIARAVLIDENNNVCLEKILDDDGFGPRDYYETCISYYGSRNGLKIRRIKTDGPC